MLEIRRIFDGFEYSTNFFCHKMTKSSNIRRLRIFDEFFLAQNKKNFEYSKASNIRRISSFQSHFTKIEYSIRVFERSNIRRILKTIFFPFLSPSDESLKVAFFKKENYSYESSNVIKCFLVRLYDSYESFRLLRKHNVILT